MDRILGLFQSCGEVLSLVIQLLSVDIDLSAGRPGDQSIHRVFVDPGGSHCIATIVGPGGADTFYTHAKWTRPRLLSKLKGLIVNAVAWNRQLITEGKNSSFLLLLYGMLFICFNSCID
mgnify:CR=1 FL=1